MPTDGASVAAGLIGGILLVVVVVLFPLAVLWAVSVIFGVPMIINFWTWLAAVVLIMAFGGIRLMSGGSKTTTVIKMEPPELP